MTTIGTPVRRREDFRFLTGQGNYTDDINRPGQLYAYILRSPHAHARIAGIDTAAARAAPGVVGRLHRRRLRGRRRRRAALRLADHIKDGSPMVEPPHPVLATDRVRHVGDPVAVVIAETLAQARDAAELVARRLCRASPPSSTRPTALKPGAPQVRDEAPGNICYDWHLGDKAAVDAAFAKAAHVAKLDLVNNRLVPNAMEPRAAIGEFDRAHRRATRSSRPARTRTSSGC